MDLILIRAFRPPLAWSRDAEVLFHVINRQLKNQHLRETWRVMLPWFERSSMPLYLAPMAGFTDLVFRQLCKEQGADVMVTEFVMANRFLVEGEDDVWDTVDFTPEQRPMGVQIFGGEPETMAEAARRIAGRLEPDFIDINFGCPAPKVVNNCAGSSLLRDLTQLNRIADAVVDAVREQVPVTAKIRIGWDRTEIVAVEAGKRLEGAGVQALAVHGRTKEQGYQGEADWGVINEVAEALAIPVVGNGSIRSADDVRRWQADSAVKGLMIGRAALGYPWIFREIKHAMQYGTEPPLPNLEERWDFLLTYCRRLRERPRYRNRWDSLNWMRPRLQAFTKILPGGKRLRSALNGISTYAELESLAREHMQYMANTERSVQTLT